jgi:2,4-dienoyl-CoA reductase-like NADH-dependent reductase (Old Yellow Enzyme family)
MSKLFSPFSLRGVSLPNRIVMSPMCMYACQDGVATDWQMVHLGSRAAGGVGLVIAEATGVSAVGRITPGCLGMWSDAHAEALQPIADFIRKQGSVPGIQLGHAGRKAGRTIPWEGNRPLSVEEWGQVLGPSAIAFEDTWQVPREMDADDMDCVESEFAEATRLAVAAGFQVVEAHAAHGYLLHEFLSPLSNRRVDAYGGSLENRMRFPLRVIRAMRAALPSDLPLFVRLSVVDWVEGGLTLDQAVTICRGFREAGVDLIDCSSGAIVPGENIPVAPGYHAPFARRIRAETAVATSVVGVITEPEQAERHIADGDADLVVLGRALLRDAYWARRAAVALEAENGIPLPIPYRRAVTGMDKRTPF